MKRTETHIRFVYYCDYCGKKLEYSHASIQYPDGKILDFCNEYTDKINKTCLDKYKEEERAKTKTIQL